MTLRVWGASVVIAAVLGCAGDSQAPDTAVDPSPPEVTPAAPCTRPQRDALEFELDSTEPLPLAATELVATTGTHAYVAGAPGGPNLVANFELNAIAPDVQTSTIAGGGAAGFPQLIGAAAGTNASYATIGGGYDNVNDQLAGTVAGGAHHLLAATGDHGTIAGGSMHTVSAGSYAFIGGGNQNEIGAGGGTPNGAVIAGGVHNVVSHAGGAVLGGSYNVVYGNSGVIGGGSKNQVLADGLGGAIGGGTQNVVAASYGTVAGGTRNDVTAEPDGTVGGGHDNAACGAFAVVAGGSTNMASAEGSGVLAGAENLASGRYAVAAGRQNEASAPYSSARGHLARATLPGQHAVAAGAFAEPGDAQAFEVVLRRETTDAAPMSLLAEGVPLYLPDRTAWAFDVLVVARGAASGENAGFSLRGVVRRELGPGSTELVAVTKEVLAAPAGWNVHAQAEPDGRLGLRVVGADGRAVRWVAHVRVAAVQQ